LGHTAERVPRAPESLDPLRGAGQRLPNRRLIATSRAVIWLRLLPLSSQLRSAAVPVRTTRVPLATDAATEVACGPKHAYTGQKLVGPSSKAPVSRLSRRGVLATVKLAVLWNQKSRGQHEHPGHGEAGPSSQISTDWGNSMSVGLAPEQSVSSTLPT
jgi:hypothetical protein